ncbi:MAG: sugar phosphate isomerase/epimerase [Nocardioides sp.]
MCYGYDGHTALCESLEKHGRSRRAVLRGAAATAAGTALVGAGAAPASAKGKPKKAKKKRVPKDRISIQLYTVRDALGGTPGFDATLRAIAVDGYPRVEMAGYYGRTAREIRAFFSEIDIRATSSHDGISADERAMHAKFENAVTLGQRFVNVPYLNSDSLSEWQRWADQMNKEARVAKTYGLAYGYHNHAHEFTIDLGGGLTPWQLFADELDPSLVHLEADLYWVVTGGLESGAGVSDPERFAIDTIKAAPQKVRQYHVKDKDPVTGDMADLGTGFIDFKRIFRAHKVEEYIVENDTPDVTPLRTSEVGYNYLRNLRF